MIVIHDVKKQAMQLARPHSIPGRGGETTALVIYPHYHLFVMLCPRVTSSGLCKGSNGHLSNTL